MKVDTLKFSIRDSKHDLLYKTLRPLATGLVKKQLQKAVADAVRTALAYVDGQLVGVRDRMREAKADDNRSRTQVLQELFQRKKDEAESVKSGAREKKEELMREVWTIMTATLGVPPRPDAAFTWDYYDKDGKPHSWSGTPREFYASFASKQYPVSSNLQFLCLWSLLIVKL